jgi:predicted nucleotidyltransferase
LLQQRMIARVRDACRGDEHVMDALVFGSFAMGKADAFFDFEFAILIRNDVIEFFAQRAGLDKAGTPQVPKQ